MKNLAYIFSQNTTKKERWSENKCEATSEIKAARLSSADLMMSSKLDVHFTCSYHDKLNARQHIVESAQIYRIMNFSLYKFYCIIKLNTLNLIIVFFIFAYTFFLKLPRLDSFFNYLSAIELLQLQFVLNE